MAARNRPRGSGFVKEDIADEQQLWHSIVEKIKVCRSLNQKYKSNQDRISTVKESLKGSESAKASISKVEELEKLHREGIKLAVEEQKTLNEEPDDLIRNLDLLISVRTALEVDVPRVNPTSNKPRNLKRSRLDTEAAADSPLPTSEVSTPVPEGRIRSVAKGASRAGSQAAVVKPDSGFDFEGVKPVFSEKQKFAIGTEVFFRHKAKENREGEGIQCKVTGILDNGKQRRYEIQDPEPNESGEMPPPYKAAVAQLVQIPPPGSVLPDIPKGKQVLALYPQTTTFYKAELVGMKRDMCRLRFEGEDEKDKEQDVERRYVLDAR
ncbi:MAG: SAGA HAT/Core module component [Alyxoria varia]|nr:MAG: SAGA HAT/Core module component [Alyxoria varia]